MKGRKAGEALDVSRACAKILAGRGPEVQGAALADLVAIWLVGHHPEIREDELRDWLALLHQLIPLNEDSDAEASRRAGPPAEGG